MTYTLVNEVPANAVYEGDTHMYISEGYVYGWGAQRSYGRNIITACYILPDGTKIAVEKYVESRFTKEEAWAELKEAGY